MRPNIQSAINHQQINGNGCLFLCHLRWAEIVSGKDFTDEEVIQFYRNAVTRTFMAPNCFINNGIGLMNMVLEAVGSKVRYRDRRDNPTDDTNQPIAIIRLMRDSDRSNHFLVRHGNTMWDSLDPKRPAARNWKPDQYRWFV